MGSNVRRSRGYNHEHDIVERFNLCEGWTARRLGGSSTGLPDIVATYNGFPSQLMVIEAKSTVDDIIYVPEDQVERCLSVVKMFAAYQSKRVLIAAKFGSKKGERRTNKEYFFDMTGLTEGRILRIHYDGRIFVKEPDKGFVERTQQFFKVNAIMPFGSLTVRQLQKEALQKEATTVG